MGFIFVTILIHHTALASLSSDRKAWVEDFFQLKKIIADVYPNLDVALNTHKLDLPQLSKQTEARLKTASSKDDAVKILQSFVEQFKDGHFKIEPLNLPSTNKTSDVPLNQSTTGIAACKALGAEAKGFHFAFLTDKESGFGELHLQGKAFPYTTMKVRSKKIGFIKVPSFLSQHYPDVCAVEWETYRNSLSSNCDKECKDKFMYVVVPNRLLQHLQTTIDNLEKENISALVIDLANNGGGNDWVGAVTRMVTKKPILCGQFGFVRHQHWIKNIEGKIKDFREQIKDATVSEKIKKELAQAESDLAEAKKSCDRSQIWKHKNFKSKCDVIVKRQVDTCDVDTEFTFNTGIYDGPLYILVNNNTASAAEDIVVRLKESEAAKIIGSKTHGSGCGFTNGGIDIKLKHLNLKVRIPDCARYLRTGANEVEGIAPNIELPQLPIGTLELTTRVREVLEKELL